MQCGCAHILMVLSSANPIHRLLRRVPTPVSCLQRHRCREEKDDTDIGNREEDDSRHPDFGDQVHTGDGDNRASRGVSGEGEVANLGFWVQWGAGSLPTMRY
jgi:hypothetical protein